MVVMQLIVKSTWARGFVCKLRAYGGCLNGLQAKTLRFKKLPNDTKNHREVRVVYVFRLPLCQ